MSQVKQAVASASDIVKQEVMPERVVQTGQLVEQSKGSDMPVWRSQAPANQYVNQASSGMGFQGSSGMENGVSARWTSATTQGTPTFVYSTAVRTVPSSAGMNTGLDDVSKSQARSLGLLQAEANARVNARAKLQSNVHLSQAPRPHVQPQMYTNTPSYGLHSNVGHAVAQNLVPTPTLQPLHNSEKQDQNSQKGNSAQPLHLQIGGVVNYEPSKSHSLPKSISLQQNPSSKPPPDLNLQPIDSPSTPQASGLPNSMGSAQPSVFLQLWFSFLSLYLQSHWEVCSILQAVVFQSCWPVGT
jgi:hypothetical protein